MVTKIVKFLKKISAKERSVIEELIISIRNREWGSLDIKKLQGESNLFRARRGSVRFFSLEGDGISIIDIQKKK